MGMTKPAIAGALIAVLAACGSSNKSDANSSGGNNGGGNSGTNQPPVANAGSARIVDERTQVTLSGASSSDPDGDTLSYSWQQTLGPAVSAPSANNEVEYSFTTPSVDQQTVLQFALTVTDPSGAADTSTATVTVLNIDPPPPPPNNAPVAHAGPDQVVNESALVTLDGSASSDADNDPLTYAWTQTDGPAVTLDDTTAVTPAFTAPDVAGTTALEFSLVVSDPDNAQSQDSVSVTVKPLLAPVGVWLKGDMHVHDDHSSDGSLPRQVMGQGAPGNTSVANQIFWAETVGLDFLPLNDHRTFDQHYDPLWQSSRLLLITGEEANSRPHATVFGAVDMINQAENPGGTPEFRKLQQSIWDAHLQGAVWATAHPDDGEVNSDGSPNSFAFATGPNLVEIWNRGTLNRPKIAYCENRWNAGYRFGVGGASDNHFIELWPVAGPGEPTTHVFAAAKNTPALLQALRAGRTGINLHAATPFASLEVDFQGDGIYEAIAGDELQVAPGTIGRMRVTVTNGMGTQVHVYRMPGTAAGPFKTFQPMLPTQSFEFDVVADQPQDWYRVELRGPGDPDGLDYNAFLDGDVIAALDPDVLNQLRAVTSPVFISTGALATPDSPDLPADAGADDGAELLLGDSRDNAFTGFADVAESNGVVHSVAEVRGDEDMRVLYRQRGSDGTLGDPMDLAPTTTLARFPRIAASDDHVWVVWQDGRNGEWPHNTQIYLRHSADGGATWEEEEQVSASSARAEHPALALLAPDLPVVVWQDNGGGAFDVLARVVGRDTMSVNLSAAGKVTSAGVPLDSRSASHPASVHPSVAVRSDGLIAVAWQDNRNDTDPGWTGRTIKPDEIDDSLQAQEFIEQGTETDDWEIFISSRQPFSAQWSAIENASQAPTLADRHPVLVFDAAGVLHAAWDSKTMHPAGPRLAIHTNHKTGASWSAPIVVDAAPDFHAQRPAFGRNGNAPSLFWMDGRSVDWRWRVRRADLDVQTGEWLVAGFVTGPGNSAWPAYGNGWLVFTSDRSAWREQRKPQQVFLRSLDEPQLATPAAGDVSPIGGSGSNSSFDLCMPLLGSPCLSQLPVLGPMLLSLLEPVLGDSEGGDAPDPVQMAAPVTTPLAEGCHDNGGPAALCAPLDRINPSNGLSRYVEPRIGSYPPGFTNPGPVLPFGMVAVGPDTEGPLNYGGYYVNNATITGFSHVHMSAGVFKAGQLPVLPFTGELVPPTPATFDPGSYGYPGTVPGYASPYERATEIAQAGYYSAFLTRYGVLAELTATERVGLHRYTYMDPVQASRLIMDISRTNNGYRTASVTLRDNGNLLTGKVRNNDAGGFDIYFAARLSVPFTVQTFDGGALTPDQPVNGNTLGLILDFPDGERQILMKLALSYTDEQGAINNLKAELPGWDFEATRMTARRKWDEALSRIEVSGGTEAEKISFYTGLYRLHHFPNLHSDVDGRYRGPDDMIRTDTRPHYSQFSSWDSYRGQNQLQAEIFPGIYGDMIHSLLAFHQQAGKLPRWQQGPKDASHMSGDPIVMFIGEAWCRGQLDAGLRTALWPALTNLVTQRHPDLDALGYLAVPPPNDLVEEIEGGSGRAGTTLEYGIADFALSLMAQAQAPAEATGIAQRSLNYRNLLDPETKWIRPRHDDGSWLTPFAPELGYGFQEGTSWQYSWLAMQDLRGLFDGMGGDAVVDQRLDIFFNFPASQAPLAWPTLQNQITAFGIAYYGNQYAPGNEHDLQAPYLYNYSGAPWKTQAVARAAASIYTATPTGLPGNDDLGGLTGWQLWTMMGLYPMNPGTPLYVVGSPHFEKVTLKRPGGDLVIEAPGASAVNRFVTGVELNDQSLNQSWLILPRTASQLRLTTSAVPDMNWAAAATSRPPSISTHDLQSFGCAAQ